MSDEAKDHYHEAREALDAAEEGFEHLERKQAPGQYAQIAIAHALLRIAEALDHMSDDLDELKRRPG